MPSPGISPPPLKRRRISGPPPQPSPPSLPCSPPSIPAQDPPSTPTSDTLRIYSWNINGITPFLPPSTPPITTFLTQPSTSNPAPPRPSLRANLKRWNWPHILCLQEVKIAPNDTKTQSSVRRAVNTPLDSDDEDEIRDQRSPHHHRLYDAHFCLPRDKHNAKGFGGRVYGVCTLVRRDVPAAPAPASVRTVEWDREGRVLLVEIPEWKVVVVNVYAVNGTTNEYRDPETGVVSGDRHGRKRVFQERLRDEVRGCEGVEEGGGMDVVVVGDLNVAREGVDSWPELRGGREHVASRKGFEELFMRGLGMADTFRAVRGLERKFTYRPRNRPWGAGGDRVDLILVSKGLMARGGVRGADILDCEEERGPSDHVPLFVEIDVGSVARGDGGAGGEGKAEQDERTEDLRVERVDR